MPPPVLTPVCLLILTLAISAAEIYCNQEYYGKPDFDDCYHLLATIPPNRDRNTRIFVEQQLREGLSGWPGVENLYQDAMVQVPKYWSHNSCNFALLSYYSSSGGSVIPLGTCSWMTVNHAANDILKSCLVEKGTGGAGAVQSAIRTVITPPRSVLAFFVWETGFPFEDLLNQYQYQPQPISICREQCVGSNMTGVGVNTTSDAL